jgi:hypothetical protein
MKPITTDGMASNTNGTVTTQGDSWGFGGMPVVTMIVMVIMVRIGILVKTFLAVKHQEIHAEGIERSDENTRHDSKVSKPCMLAGCSCDRLNDAVFGVEA